MNHKEKVVQILKDDNINSVVQFTEIMDIVPEVISAYECDDDLGTIFVFRVNHERFLFTIQLDKNGEYVGCDTVPDWFMSCSAVVDSVKFDELNLKIKATKVSKVSKKTGGLVLLHFYPKFEDIFFDLRLEQLLSYIEENQNEFEILKNVSENVCLRICPTVHYGNGLIGGVNFSSDILKRITFLNLDLDVDWWVTGNPYNS